MRYLPGDRDKLLALLGKAAPEAPDRGAQAAMHERLVFELDAYTSHLVSRYAELGGGNLDRRLREVKQLDALKRTAASLQEQVSNLGTVLSEYGSSTVLDVSKTLTMLQTAAEFCRVRNSSLAPGYIKSEGAKNLANALLNEFLVIASYVWFQGTAMRPKPNMTEGKEPSGPYAKFIFIAAQPLLKELNQQRKGLVSGDWASLCQRLERTINIREVNYLSGVGSSKRTRHGKPQGE
jgi:hypothetical protein